MTDTFFDGQLWAAPVGVSEPNAFSGTDVEDSIPDAYSFSNHQFAQLNGLGFVKRDATDNPERRVQVYLMPSVDQVLSSFSLA